MSKNIGLALSGGGFRATLFHLGVIACLRDRGLLSDIKLISSVSGGSVFAAHLAMNWSRYKGNDEEFAEASNELLAIIRFGLRGAVIRRWLLGSLLIVPRILGKFTFHSLMVKQLQKLYKGASLTCLSPSDGPRCELLATSITSGNLCKFTSNAFIERLDWENVKSVRSTEFPVAVAVAASAAFPPLFPPVPVDRKTLKTDAKLFDQKVYLTDGGIFDNLGLEELYRVSTSEQALNISELVVSDAGGNFDWAPDRAFSFIINRNVRATDILMDRVSKLVPSFLVNKAKSITHVFIGKELSVMQEPTAQSPETQWLVRNTRTDFDAFCEAEIVAIARHGFGQASWSLRESGLATSNKKPVWSLLKEPLEATKKLGDKPKGRSIGLFCWSDPVSFILWGLLLLPTALFSFRVREDIESAYFQIVDANRTRTVEVRVEDLACPDLSGAVLNVSTLRYAYFHKKIDTMFGDTAFPGTSEEATYQVKLPFYGTASISVVGQKTDWNTGDGEITWTTQPVILNLAKPKRTSGKSVMGSWIEIEPQDGGDLDVKVHHTAGSQACPAKKN